MNTEQPLLQLHEIGKEYPVPGREPVKVLRDISLEVKSGASLAIVGPSGSGKSTLLNIVGGLDRPTSGRAILDGRDLGTLSDRELAAVRNRDIGFVFQLHHLLPQCTVLENVLVPTLPGHVCMEPEEAIERAAELLDDVGLAARIDHRPGQLSGGESLRVAVVRALINNPKLLLADEPTGSLDRDGARNLTDILVQMNEQQGVTVIAVTHSEQLAERMERCLLLRDGRLDGGGC